MVDTHFRRQKNNKQRSIILYRTLLITRKKIEIVSQEETENCLERLYIFIPMDVNKTVVVKFFSQDEAMKYSPVSIKQTQ